MLEDFRLIVFVTVAQMRSFTKAAVALHISQPAVSQHISELEKQLGIKLFQRLRGEIELTPAGRVFHSCASRILDSYRHAALMFSRHPAGVVKVAASEDVYDYMMDVLLADFIVVNPEITFVKSFPDDADLRVTLVPDDKEKGTLALSFRPSESLESTPLWVILSDALKPALK